MKIIVYTLLAVLMLSKFTFAQEFNDEIRLQIDKNIFTSNTEIVIKNINGNVHVSGYNGEDIIVEGTKNLWKKRGKISENEANLYSVQKTMYEGKLYIYVVGPESNFEFKNGRMNYNWNNDNGIKINSNFDLEIKIPQKLALHASTVNGGDVFIENMENGVIANNVNGSILVKDAKAFVLANTVNGDIEIWFIERPTADVNFTTINGNIEIHSPKDLSAIVTFESLHGELYTDFEQVKHLPNRLNKEKAGGGFRYLLNKTSPIQIGDGKVELEFKMVNGDAYLRTRKS